jgi:hypothetical protein
MLKPFYVLSLAAAISAAVLIHPALAADPPPLIDAERVAACEYQARLYAESRIILGHRIKVPIAAGAAVLLGAGPVGVLLAGTIAANAESPIERRAIVRYRNWCMGIGPAPRGL